MIWLILYGLLIFGELRNIQKANNYIPSDFPNHTEGEVQSKIYNTKQSAYWAMGAATAWIVWGFIAVLADTPLVLNALVGIGIFALFIVSATHGSAAAKIKENKVSTQHDRAVTEATKKVSIFHIFLLVSLALSVSALIIAPSLLEHYMPTNIDRTAHRGVLPTN